MLAHPNFNEEAGGVTGIAPRREQDLDVVRGVAILLAMGWHFNTVSSQWSAFDVVLAPGRIIGWAGVDLFFVLSGFLVGRLILREVESTGAFNYKRFFCAERFDFGRRFTLF
ncbi:acyltransferase family protein [Aquincola tertiaricarbonis]|uniref:acyltransferase family protein n=1 Tax=Aquincola tertiaricarbonis TaxID=391953 RepID=UPI0035BEE115